MPEIQGGLEGHGIKIGIVVARFNEFITKRLLEGALSALHANGVTREDISVVYVPGSFEVPIVAKNMAGSGGYNAVICLGSVIKGETDHYDYVAGEAARGINQAGMQTGVPVLFGILTTNTIDQAVARSGGPDGEFVDKPLSQRKPDPMDTLTSDSQGNAGYSAGLAAIEMANLLIELRSE